MALFRKIDPESNTVQFLYKGEPVTPVMKLDDANALYDGLGTALNEAYNKLRDTEEISN